MSLLNSVLALGALAFTIPLAIHLLFRSRYKTVDWGAMYLLESVVRVNRRRIQIANLLLLLLRCAIPILLAFCLARPVWNSARAVALDAPKTLVIAVDDSRSMSVTPVGQPSRIELAKQEIRSVMSDLSRRDEIMIVRSSRLGAVPSKMGLSDALVALRRIDAQGNAVSMGQLLDAAIGAAEDGSHSRRQILLVSDFQDSTLDAQSLEFAKRVSADGRGDSRTEDSQWMIDLLDVSAAWDDLANLSIDSLTIDTPVVTEKRSATYSATIRNDSDLPARDLQLVWSVDGVPLDPRVLSVDANSAVTNRLTHTIDSSGIHEVSARISRSDMLPADNRRSVAVDVIREVNVLLVDGKPDSRPLRGQADYLAIALSPFAFGGDDRPDPVRAAVVPERKLGGAIDETDCRVVLLAGVGRLSESSKKKLTEFVCTGGALVVFDGPAVRPELFNTPWSAGEHELGFPARLGALLGSVDGEASQDASQCALDRPMPFYAPWRLLGRNDENPFSDVRVSTYRSLQVEEATGDGSDSALVLLRSTNGQPIAVSRRIGEGSVVQFAISGNDAWSTLPLRPVFLPMIQQLVLDLAGRQDDANFDVGTPISIRPDRWPASSLSDSAAVRYTANTPGGEFELPAPPEGDPLRVTSTFAPGTYRVVRRTYERSSPEDAEVVEQVRVASVSPSESLLVGATQQRIDAFADELGATVFETAAVLRSADRSRSFGREIWRWLLAALLIALIAELWLQQNLVGRQKTQGGAA